MAFGTIVPFCPQRTRPAKPAIGGNAIFDCNARPRPPTNVAFGSADPFLGYTLARYSMASRWHRAKPPLVIVFVVLVGGSTREDKDSAILDAKIQD